MAPTLFCRVKVALHAFRFPFALRNIDNTITSQLVNVFDSGGVQKDIPNNIIPADLADIPLDIPSDDTIIESDFSCLHGQHRIAAALRCINNPTDQWWYVYIYTDLTAEDRAEIIKGAIYQGHYSDGQILKQILRGNDIWWAAFSKSKKRLAARIQRNIDLWQALQQLKDLDGLWESPNIHFGNFTNISSISGVKPQLINYLSAIHTFWNSLPAHSQDANTVNNLNLLCPQVPLDRRAILALFSNKQLFCCLSGNERDRALEVVLSSTILMIPTICSLFDNLL